MDQAIVYVAATLISVGASYGRLSAQIKTLTTLHNKQAKVLSEVRDRVISHLGQCPLSKDENCVLHENPAAQLPTNGD